MNIASRMYDLTGLPLPRPGQVFEGQKDFKGWVFVVLEVFGDTPTFSGFVKCYTIRPQDRLTQQAQALQKEKMHSELGEEWRLAKICRDSEGKLWSNECEWFRQWWHKHRLVRATDDPSLVGG